MNPYIPRLGKIQKYKNWKLARVYWHYLLVGVAFVVCSWEGAAFCEIDHVQEGSTPPPSRCSFVSHRTR